MDDFGTRFMGGSSGIKQTIAETITLAKRAERSNLRISLIFSIVSTISLECCVRIADNPKKSAMSSFLKAYKMDAFGTLLADYQTIDVGGLGSLGTVYFL